MSLRLLIGHALPGQRGPASALYIGPSGAELEAAKQTKLFASFTILNNPVGIRKSNPLFDPAAVGPVSVAGGVDATAEPIVVTVGEGDKVLTLRVSTEEDAGAAREICEALLGAVADNERLNQNLTSVRAAAQDEERAVNEQLAVAAKALSDAKEKAAGLEQTLNEQRELELSASRAAAERIATLEADLAAAQAEAAKVATLEAQLAEATAKLAKKAGK